MVDEPFAPKVPAQNEPNYLNYFRAAHPYQGSEAGKYKLGGLGHAIGAGAEALDNTMKHYVTAQTQQQTDPVQEAFTKTLEDNWKTVQGGEQQPGGDSGGSAYVGQSTEPAPPEIKQGLDNARTVQSAREYGKIPYTYYLGQLNSIAKSLRAQYPGYREEVDKTMHQITGHPIGNAYMMSLLSEIQAASSGKDKDMERLRGHLDTLIFQGEGRAVTLKQQLEKGANPDWVRAEVAKTMGWKANAERLTAEANSGKYTDEIASRIHSKAMNETFSNKMTEFITAPSIPFQGKNMSWIDLQEGIHSGKIPWDLEKSRAASLQMQMGVEALGREMMKMAKEAKDENGLSWYANDPEGVKKAITEAKEGAMEMVKSLGDKNHLGIAGYFSGLVEAQREDDAFKMTQDKDIGTVIRMSTALKRVLGENEPEVSTWIRNHMTDISAGLKKFETFQKSKMALQPDKETKGIFTLEDANQNSYQTAEIDPRTGKKYAMPDTFQGYVNEISNLHKMPAEMQQNYVEAFYSHKNDNVLAWYARDDVDPQTGRHVPGKFAIYNQLTSSMPNNRAIAKLDPKYSEMQRGWAETTFRKLFAGEIQTISQFPAYPGVKIGYDSDAHQIKIDVDESKLPKEALGSVRNAVTMLKQSEYNLNLGLHGLSSIALANRGMDVNKYLLGMMRDLGYDPTKMVTGRASNTLIDSMMNSIMGVAVPHTPDTAGRRLRKQEDE